MNGFIEQQAEKILACYGIMKGGIGSGRHKEGKSSVQKLEESNFSSQEENEQRKRADKLASIKKEIEILEGQIKKKEAILVDKKRTKSSYERANMTRDADYMYIRGSVAKFEREVKELKAIKTQKQGEFDALNH